MIIHHDHALEICHGFNTLQRWPGAARVANIASIIVHQEA